MKSALHPSGTFAARPSLGVERTVVVIALIAVAGLASLFGAPEHLRQPILVGITGLLTVGPLVFRGLQGKWDPFEPLVLLMVGCFVIFFLRPVWMWATGEYDFSIFDLRDGLTGGALIANVGVASLLVGYAVNVGPWIGQRLHPLKDSWDSTRVTNACLVLFVLAAFLFSFYIGTSGGLGTLKTVFSGRSSTDRTLGVSSSTGKASSYFSLAASMVIPVSLVMVEVWRRTRRPWHATLAIALVLMALITTVPRGDRTQLLFLLLPLISIPFLLTNRRPRMRSVIVAVVVAIIVFNFLEGFRSTEKRQGGAIAGLTESFTHPFSQFGDFMLGDDTAMYSVLAAESKLVPSKVDYKPGQTATSVILLPVPGPLWPGKPQEPSQFLYQEMFPQNAAVTKAGFGPSMLGGFYIDSGFFGVAIYCLITGIALRTLFEYYKANRLNRTVCVVYAALLPLIIIMLRASPALTIGGSLFLVGPIFAAFWWGSRKPLIRRAPRVVTR